jgi:hypothetical protein
MPRPSSLACTTAASASPPKTQPPSPAPTIKRRGNPTLALIPRCGARTRAGCPCRAPAIHGKVRCPAGQARGQAPHGGRSTGPRTAEGMARLRAAHTTHGDYSAENRAFLRHHVTFPPAQPRAVVRGASPRPPAARACRSHEPDGAGATVSIPTDRRHQPGGGPCPAKGRDRSPCTVEARHGAGPPVEARGPDRTVRNGSGGAGKTPCTRTGGGRGCVRVGCVAGRLRSSPAKTPCTNFPRPRRNPTRSRPRQALVRQRRQNPMQQNAPRPECAMSRHRPAWQGSQNPMHQFPRPRRNPSRSQPRQAPVQSRRPNPMHQNAPHLA